MFSPPDQIGKCSNLTTNFQPGLVQPPTRWVFPKMGGVSPNKPWGFPTKNMDLYSGIVGGFRLLLASRIESPADG